MGFGLAARVTAIGASVLLALWVAMIALFYWTNDLSHTATRLPAEQLKAIVTLIDATAPAQRPLALDALQSSMLSLSLLAAPAPPAGAAEMRDESGFATYRELLGARLLSIRLLEVPETITRPRLFQRAARPLSFQVTLADGQVLLAEARTPFIVTFYGLPAGMGAGLVGTLFAAIAFFLLHREIQPLTRLAAAVDAIDPSGEPVPLPTIRATTPEIRALMRAFERLQSRLRVMTRSRMALIGGIQHDVRSFATRLRLRLEQLPDAAERERATADITDMIDLLDNALLTSRAGVGALEEEMLDLAEFLRGEVADFRRAGQPVVLEPFTPDGEAWMIGDRLALRRVIGNIVDNAVKYGRSARVSLMVDSRTLHVLIADEGPGFSVRDGELLLEPFVRAEPPRARATGGAGLGLAVARTLIEAQGGSVRLGNGQQGGLVELVLPRFTST
ncbi:HAMP domain-containing protein [Ochrobactrum sp. XJ1]|nr:HAMP domain-containing protein [Ochrobactrum sp. XJ1]